MGWEKDFGNKLERVLPKIHPETCFHEMNYGATEHSAVFAIEDKLGHAKRRFESVLLTITKENAEEVLAELPSLTRQVFAKVEKEQRRGIN